MSEPTTAVEATQPSRRVANLEPQSLNDLDVLASTLTTAQTVPMSKADIMAMALSGLKFGWGVMDSVERYHIIQGQATLKPEAMLGIIRSHGHSVVIEPDDEGVSVTGKRRDTGDQMTTRFTLDDAKRIGLAGKDNWVNYPTQMCQWRAVSALAKALFTDLLMGFYVPDEMGAPTNADGEPVDLTASDVTQVKSDPPKAKRKSRAKSKPATEVVDAEIVVDDEFNLAAAKKSLIAVYQGVYDATDGCERDATADAAAQWNEYIEAHPRPTTADEFDPLLVDALTRARGHVLADETADA